MSAWMPSCPSGPSRDATARWLCTPAWVFGCIVAYPRYQGGDCSCARTIGGALTLKADLLSNRDCSAHRHRAMPERSKIND